MAIPSEIAAVLARRLQDGADTLRDADGRPATLAVPLAEDAGVELALNPATGPVLRIRQQTAQMAAAQREARMAALVRLTAEQRLGTGWIGGCDPDGSLTLAVALDPRADSARIEALIAAGRAILRDGRGSPAAPDPAPDPGPVVGSDWLRL